MNGHDYVCKGNINDDIDLEKIHFDDKEILMSWLDKFQKDKLYPKTLCIENKLGILLYGPPGTGKTILSVAIAKKLKRNLLIINSFKLYGEDSKSNFLRVIQDKQDNSVIILDEFDMILKSSLENNNSNHFSHIYSQFLYTSDKQEREKMMESIK